MGACEAVAAHDAVKARADPEVLLLRDIMSGEARWHAERIIRSVGRTALEGAVQAENANDEHQTLMDAIRHAAEGSQSARRLVEADVMTDLMERAFKTGAVMSLELIQHEDGRMSQYGQSMRQVYRNALAYAAGSTAMRRRIEAETRNGLGFEDAARLGLFQDYNIVIFSLFPDDMPIAEARKAGFFTESMAGAIQVIGLHDDGRLMQDSAFVAGVREGATERHDITAIRALAAELGVSYEGRTVTEILATPLLVHRSVLPDVLSVVRCYDALVGGTFFGQDQPAQDYAVYRQWCEARQERFRPTATAIADELVARARELLSPPDAVTMLHQLSQQALVDIAVVTSSIDERVFGTQAAAHIEEARRALAAGNMEQFAASREKAQDTAQSASCPLVLKDEFLGDADSSAESSNAKGEIKRMKCPFCSEYYYGDPCSPNQQCANKHCGAELRNGKVVNRGKQAKQMWELLLQTVQAPASKAA